MNATVTLPLSEIDALRNELESTKRELVDTQGKIASVQVEVTEVKADSWMGYDAHGRPRETITTGKVVSWKNMQDVVEGLRQAELEKIETTISNFRKTINQLEKRNKSLHDTLAATNNEIRRLNGVQVDKEKDEKIADLTKTVERWMNGYNDAQEVIKSLTARIDTLSRKPWYKFW